jgi:hypothetical protein
MPCWRIVFSTFRGCMSFYTGRVKLRHGGDAERDIGSFEIPQRSSLLPYGGVLSFLWEAREKPGSEPARVHHAAREQTAGGVIFRDC